MQLYTNISRQIAAWAARHPRWVQPAQVLIAVAFFGGHYTFGEWVQHPEVAWWRMPLFWSDLPGFLVIPPLFWAAAWLVSFGQVRAAAIAGRMALALVVGDVAWHLIATAYPFFKKPLPLDYWFYWSWWLPALVAISGAIVAWKAFRIWFGGVGILAPFFRSHPVLQALAASVSLLAAILTGAHLGLPRLPVSPATLDLTRDLLVRDSEQTDFAYLAGLDQCRGRSLGALLEHLRLARLQRLQFYSDLSDAHFRAYVLSPLVAQLPLSEIAWRRQLWREFYPAIRNLHDPREGARVVLRNLRQRVAVASDFCYRVGPETIWIQRAADPAGFTRLGVAALRAVGIAARINAGQQLEFWADGRWVAVASEGMISVWREEPAAESEANQSLTQTSP